MRVSPFTKSYRGRLVLQTPELVLKKDRIYAVIGANGSGKSTFVRILAGVVSADQKGPVFAQPCRTGYMPQKSYAFRMSVMKNILLGGKDRKRAGELMCQLGIDHLAEQRADRLSGGETARMALARTLMQRYEMVFLDEPAAAMDISSTALAEEMILRYRCETKCAVLIVTHSIRQAQRLADEVFFFHQGKLWETGGAEQVLGEPEKDETQRFMKLV